MLLTTVRATRELCPGKMKTNKRIEHGYVNDFGFIVLWVRTKYKIGFL